MKTSSGPCSYLIVNADDFGWFKSVSRGILHCFDRGSVTATAIMANGPEFTEQARWLRDQGNLDAGVHLNLSRGRPLTSTMAGALTRWGGNFPGKFAMARAILCGYIPMDVVMEELKIQIQRCRDFGLEICFVNSHEHLHMLPFLLPKVVNLAHANGIRHVRNVGPEWLPMGSMDAWLRNICLKLANTLNKGSQLRLEPTLIGLSVSGRMHIDYLRRCFAAFKPGRVYELMCHPGYWDPVEITDQRLILYHRWETELRVLEGQAFRELCVDHQVRLIGYRGLDSTLDGGTMMQISR